MTTELRNVFPAPAARRHQISVLLFYYFDMESVTWFTYEFRIPAIPMKILPVSTVETAGFQIAIFRCLADVLIGYEHAARCIFLYRSIQGPFGAFRLFR